MSIDFDNIKGELLARNRLPGDKIRMGGMSKSVKKLMCDKKIPLDLRSRIPMTCDGNGIIESMDYVLLNRKYFGTYQFDEDQMLKADVDDSYEIDSMDYVLLRRVYFGAFTFKEPIVYK